MSVCSNCGTELPAGASVCPACGQPVSQSSSVAAPRSTVYQADSDADVTSFVAAENARLHTLICPQCGMPLQVPADGRFATCSTCGAVIDTERGKIVIEEHKHVTNQIHYENVAQQFRMNASGTTAFALTGMGNAASVDVPLGIVVLADGFMRGSAGTTHVSIPQSVRRIGSEAFCDCAGLTEVRIPESVDYIGEGAFENCTSLESITIPDGTQVGPSAFRGCTGLVRAIVGKNVKLGDSAFMSCTNLGSVQMGEGSTLARAVFANCGRLSSAEVPNGVSEIPDYAFSDCADLSQVDLPDGLAKIGGAAFRGCSSLQEIALPATLQSIGTNAFEKCCNLGTVDVPFGVSLGDGVFKGCSLLCRASLWTIGFPDAYGATATVSIPPETFCGCDRLARLDLPGGLVSVGDSAFDGCRCLEELPLAGGDLEVGSRGFCGCSNLRFVGGGRLQASDFAFAGCNLDSVSLWDDAVGVSAFEGSRRLSSVELPGGLTTIRSNAFAGCPELSCVRLPSTVMQICSGAFRGCAELSRIEFEGTLLPVVDPDAFEGCERLETIRVSMSALLDWSLDSLPDDAAQTFATRDRNTSAAFASAPALTNLEVPDLAGDQAALLNPRVFGDRTVILNGYSLVWGQWINSWRQALEQQRIAAEQAAQQQAAAAAAAEEARREAERKKHPFGNLFGRG